MFLQQTAFVAKPAANPFMTNPFDAVVDLEDHDLGGSSPRALATKLFAAEVRALEIPSFRKHSVNFREHSVNFRELLVNFRDIRSTVVDLEDLDLGGSSPRTLATKLFAAEVQALDIPSFREHSVNFREQPVSYT
jgi:hypothetical protein